MPCLVAFLEDTPLPMAVLGPVDFFALRLLALNCALLAMGRHGLGGLGGLGLPEFKVRHEAPRPAVECLNPGLVISQCAEMMSSAILSPTALAGRSVDMYWDLTSSNNSGLSSGMRGKFGVASLVFGSSIDPGSVIMASWLLYLANSNILVGQ